MLAIPALAQPATTQSSADLLNGKLHYLAPPGWDFQGVRVDDRSAGYTHDAHPAGLIVITVAPQPTDIPPNLGNALYQQLLATIKSESAKGNIHTIMPPRRISDARFLLRLHDQFRAQDKFADREIVYRAVGRDLVSVVSTAFSQDAVEQSALDDAGRATALSATLSPTTRPSP